MNTEYLFKIPTPEEIQKYSNKNSKKPLDILRGMSRSFGSLPQTWSDQGIKVNLALSLLKQSLEEKQSIIPGQQKRSETLDISEEERDVNENIAKRAKRLSNSLNGKGGFVNLLEENGHLKNSDVDRTNLFQLHDQWMKLCRKIELTTDTIADLEQK